MRTGTYEAKNGEKVHVQRTASGGYRLTHEDGSTTMIGGSK